MAGELYQLQNFTRQLFSKDKKRQTNRSFSIRKENTSVNTQVPVNQSSQAKTKSQSLQSSKEVLENVKQQENMYQINFEEKLKKFAAPKQKFSQQDVPRSSLKPLAEIVQEALQNKTMEERLRSSHKKKIQSSRSSVAVPKMADYVQDYNKQQLVQLLPVNLRARDEVNQKYLSNNHAFDINASAESVKYQIKERRKISTQQRQSRSGLQHYQRAIPNQNEEMAVPRALRQPYNTEQELIIEEQNSRDKPSAPEMPQGIRIKINKERKIVNHLSNNHENTNLLFYNFNQFNENNTGERIPTRGGVKSRKEVRERQVVTADQNNAPFTLSLGFNKSNFHHNQSGQSTAEDSMYHKEKVQDFSAEQVYGNDYEQIRQSLLQNDNSSGRSVSCSKNQGKIPNSKIRRGKTLGRIAKIKVKSVEDEILEEMSGGEEDLA